MNALTAEPYCGCDPLLLRQYYFPPLRLCYEHHTRGPCESGLLFAYNHTADLTHCLCAPSLDNFHPESQQCFQFGTKGPCQKGQVRFHTTKFRMVTILTKMNLCITVGVDSNIECIKR